MRYSDLSDIGVFLWWLFMRFCKTNLEDEYLEKHWGRNIFVLIMVFIVLIGLSIVFCEN